MSHSWEYSIKNRIAQVKTGNKNLGFDIVYTKLVSAFGMEVRVWKSGRTQISTVGIETVLSKVNVSPVIH